MRLGVAEGNVVKFAVLPHGFLSNNGKYLYPIILILMLEIEGITRNVLGLILFTISMRVIGMLRDRNRLIDHG